jgi:hypothetical protein
MSNNQKFSPDIKINPTGNQLVSGSYTPGNNNAIRSAINGSNILSHSSLNQVANGYGDIPDIFEGINNISMSYNQLLYQKLLIDASNNMDENAKILANKKLLCVNKLNWHKVKWNFIYIIIPLLLIILFIFLGIKFSKNIIFIGALISGIIFMININFTGPYYKNIKWSKMLYDINIAYDISGDITDLDIYDIMNIIKK